MTKGRRRKPRKGRRRAKRRVVAIRLGWHAHVVERRITTGRMHPHRREDLHGCPVKCFPPTHPSILGVLERRHTIGSTQVAFMIRYAATQHLYVIQGRALIAWECTGHGRTMTPFGPPRSKLGETTPHSGHISNVREVGRRTCATGQSLLNPMIETSINLMG